jgi:xylan 1,4-beta-xylosidase
MGPWLADTIRRCDGLVDMMSYWTFSDVFEEGGPVKTPFYGGFGLIAAGGIKKPAYYAFSVLHKLGEQRLENAASNLLVTRRKDGTLVVAAWNLADADHGMQGASTTLQLVFKGIPAHATASIARVDAAHGNPLPAYQSMNSPQYPTRAQVAELNRASALPAPERAKLANGVLQLTLPVNGLAVIELPVR